MTNFYGQYIGFGSAPSGGAAGVWIGGRGLIAGGSYGYLDVIEYTTIASTGNGTDFGNLTDGRYGLSGCAGGAGASTRGIFLAGLEPAHSEIIDYVTIASTGDAIDWGAALTVAREYGHAGSNGVRGLNFAGYKAAPPISDVIDYVTIATTGSCLDFGDIDVPRYGNMVCADATKAICAGGYPAPVGNVIQYVTVATVGNAVDFADLLEGRNFGNSCSNTTRGLIAGGGPSASIPGDTIQYITMATIGGDAIDFGNLTAIREGMGAYASATRACFSGGHPPVYSDQIQYVTIASLGDAANFGDLLSGKGGTLGACSGD